MCVAPYRLTGCSVLHDLPILVAHAPQLFFYELNEKDNSSIYNHLPDIVSSLSVGENALSEEAFARVAKFLFDFVKKDKQTENLVERLCQRFKQTEEPRHWRDLAYCLSLLPYTSEKSIKRLVDSLPLYQDKLHEPAVYAAFEEILAKTRKFPKPEIKAFADEFEAKLAALHNVGVENEATVAKAVAATKKATAKGRGGKKAKSVGFADEPDVFEVVA